MLGLDITRAWLTLNSYSLEHRPVMSRLHYDNLSRAPYVSSIATVINLYSRNLSKSGKDANGRMQFALVSRPFDLHWPAHSELPLLQSEANSLSRLQ